MGDFTTIQAERYVTLFKSQVKFYKQNPSGVLFVPNEIYNLVHHQRDSGESLIC